MSLYGDLPQAKDDESGAGKAGWAAASKKLQPTFRPKAVAGAPGAAGTLVPAAVRAAGRGSGPAAAGRGGGRGPPPVSLHAPMQPGPAPLNAAAGVQQQQQQHAHAHSSFAFLTALNGQPLQDEYDPAKPNDYEELMKARAARQRAAEEEAERAARERDADQEAERRRREQQEAAAFVAAAGQRPGAPAAGAGLPGLGAAAAAAAAAAGPGHGSEAAAGAGEAGSGAGAAADGSGDDDYERERQRRLKLSGEEAFLARARRSGASPAGFPPSTSQPAAAAAGAGTAPQFAPPGGSAAAAAAAAAGGGKGMGLAQKLLEKMGWREGQGLGRHRQGMATPLVAQKTAAHAGVIVNADGSGAPKPRGAVFNGPPTRVVVLRNMVGPGEVDEDLEEEVGNELTKYGTVEDVMIFEVTTAGYPPEEAVRIFVKFVSVEAATKALVDLQGRFFAGREVRAAFFSEDRFGKRQLAPQAGEFGPS